MPEVCGVIPWCGIVRHGRGADAEDRLGPVRVTAGGLVPPRQVLIAT